MFNTINNIDNNSVPYYLSRDTIESRIDTFFAGGNSFEYIPINKSNYMFDVEAISSGVTGTNIYEGISGTPLMVSPSVTNLLFLILVAFLVLISFVTRRDRAIFSSFFSVVSTRTRSAFKEQITTGSIWMSILLVIQTIFVLSIMTTILLLHYSSTSLPVSNVYYLLLLVFAGIALFIISKYIIYSLIDYIFPDWGLRELKSQYFTFMGLMGMVIYLPSLISVFATEHLQISIWFIIAGILVILFIFYRNLLTVFVKNNVGLLNYFLYLCAIEIVPLLLLYKSGEILAIIAGK